MLPYIKQVVLFKPGSQNDMLYINTFIMAAFCSITKLMYHNYHNII